MGKIRTVKLGDEKAEELARAKAQAKREGKKLLKKSEPKAKSDVEKSAEIFKMLAEEKPSVVENKQKGIVIEKKAKKAEKKAEIKETKTEVKKEKPTGGRGKKYDNVRSMVEKNKLYSLSEAIELVKNTSYSKFDGTIEAHINVSEKGLRGTVQLPHGIGKVVKIAIATDEILAEVEAGKINFDILVAHPSMMPKLAKVAKILGPKGLMPNPKTGTIGDKPEEIVKKLASGQTNWKTETDFPIIHLVLGKVSFDGKKIEENYLILAKSIGKDKIKSVFLKATMGPSVKIQI